MRPPNQAAAGNGATTLLCHAGRPGRTVPEQRRWAMNIWRTFSLAALLGLNPFLALAQGDALLRVWADPGVSAKERAAAVNRAFPRGTPTSLIVTKLGTNHTRGTAYGAPCLVYSFGRESVAIGTPAA
jgi:hypothetical protein